MKRIAIFCVTYHTYEHLDNYLRSIEASAEQAKGSAEVTVCIADNTEKDIKKIDFQSDSLRIKCYEFHKNYGYFGAIGRMMADMDVTRFDYVVLSNVDITIAKDAIATLCQAKFSPNTGWIAPQIYSELEHRDRNPSVMHRYSRKKLQMLGLMYRFPLIDWIYRNTLYQRKKLPSSSPHEQEIYAGHGSFIILTQEYIRRAGVINYPVFLYGEELYLAERCRETGLQVVYCPHIRITDSEHASTKSLASKFYYRCNREAISYILKRFYS